VIPRELLPLLFRRTLALWLLVRLLLGMAGAIPGGGAGTEYHGRQHP
jgi:hypothetical protein